MRFVILWISVGALPAIGDQLFSYRPTLEEVVLAGAADLPGHFMRSRRRQVGEHGSGRVRLARLCRPFVSIDYLCRISVPGSPGLVLSSLV